jgi:hypothetical protein
MNDELKKDLERSGSDLFEVLLHNLPAGNNRTTNNLGQESQYTSRDSNQTLPEHYR